MRSVHDLLTEWPALDVGGKRARLLGTLRVSPGPLAAAIAADISAVTAATSALWRRDASLWSLDAATQDKIANRLGWLASPALMADSIDRVGAFAEGVKRDGFTHVVLLGMGGSSLAPEVLSRILGVARGWPQFQMLDSTDPAAVLAADTPVERTLYLLASKSGTTIEPSSMAAHFRQRLQARVSRWADHFVAITDAGTELSRRAEAEGFRDTFINPSDIGGRYSAVSFFGLVPAALMGHDLRAFVGWSLGMLSAADPGSVAPNVSADTNPAAALGLAIGAAARAGRDKLTLLLPPALEPFGLWVEQLVAESTGKASKGVVPIAGESLAAPDRYAADRLFVRVSVQGEAPDTAIDSTVAGLRAAGEPVVDIEWPERAALGAEFVRWEVATALAGAMLAVNPFDEPNVQQAKDATMVLLNQYKVEGRLANACAERALPGGVGLALTSAARAALGDQAEAVLTLLGEGDYFALLAYVGPDHRLTEELQSLRNAVRDRTRAATMLGYGPRYLHSTGQLHKGGPNSGVFVLITASPAEDLPIPGQPFSFGTLELAQGLGDFASLEESGRRALHVHLPRPDATLIRRLADALLLRLAQRSG